MKIEDYEWLNELQNRLPIAWTLKGFSSDGETIHFNPPLKGALVTFSRHHRMVFLYMGIRCDRSYMFYDNKHFTFNIVKPLVSDWFTVWPESRDFRAA